MASPYAHKDHYAHDFYYVSESYLNEIYSFKNPSLSFAFINQDLTLLIKIQIHRQSQWDYNDLDYNLDSWSFGCGRGWSLRIDLVESSFEES